MKTLLLIPAIVFGLTACEAPLNEQTVHSVQLSKVNGLSDCTAYKFENRLYVVRCPLSETSTNTFSGKSSTQRTTVVTAGGDLTEKESTSDQKSSMYNACLIKGIDAGLKPAQITDICNQLK